VREEINLEKMAESFVDALNGVIDERRKSKI
jgi:hypothetical protein